MTVIKSKGPANLGGQELSVGDAVIYQTRSKYPRVSKGIIVAFRTKVQRRWDDHKRTWSWHEVYVPKIYSWSKWEGKGFARWHLDCNLVFPINQTADEIQKELTT